MNGEKVNLVKSFGLKDQREKINAQIKFLLQKFSGCLTKNACSFLKANSRNQFIMIKCNWRGVQALSVF